MKFVWPLVAGLLVGAAGMAVWQAASPVDDAVDAVEIGVDAPRAPNPDAPPSRPRDGATHATLLDIAGTVDDFARNKALYALVSGLDQPAVEALIAETRSLPSSPHRNDIARVLYIRLASIAPEAAADHVLDSFYQPSWLVAVFRVWAHADFDAALERAALLESPEKRLVAEALLQMDVPPWQRQNVADQLDAGTFLARLVTREELASGTPARAWANALASPPSAERRAQLSMAIRAWTKQDPEAALRAAEAVTGQRGQQLALSVLIDWAKADPTAALRWLAQQERSDRNATAAAAIIRTIAQRDINAAVAAMDGLPDWARQDRHMRMGLLQRWMETDLAAALDWFGTLTLAEQRQLHPVVGSQFAQRDPQGALDWALAADPKIRESFLSHVINSIQDAATAERLFRRINDVELKSEVAFWLYNENAHESPADALRWAATFAPEVAERLRSTIILRWAATDPDDAVRHVRGMRDTKQRDSVADDLIWRLLSDFHADQAERLFQQMQLAPYRGFAAMALLRYFEDEATRDPDKAAYYRAVVEGSYEDE